MKKFITIAFLGILILLMHTGVSQARVDMVPSRLIFETRDRADEITILNLSDETREFKVKVINYQQAEGDGHYETIEEPLSPDFNPADIVRMSPRSFTLGPNGKQRVRISLRKPVDLPDGEYRFHVLATSYATQQETEAPEDNIGVFMAINVGIAIPVIIRQGELAADGSLTNFDLVDAGRTNSGKPELKFTATRKGTSSTLGEITVEWTKDGENYEQIGFITNFNVFTELEARDGNVPLNVLPRQGTLRVTYRDSETKAIYDEIILDL